MPLYLVRHAHAVTKEEDPRRPLSERGRAQVRSLATFFRGNNLFTPAHVWHSPLIRSRETAELLLVGLASEAALVEAPGLQPEDTPEEIATRINAITSAVNVAIVGHQPQLGALATRLVRGKDGPELFDFKKGAVLALDRTTGAHKTTGQPRWLVSWLITPDLLAVKPATEIDL
jgi:phosphohistidine phosphatase